MTTNITSRFALFVAIASVVATSSHAAITTVPAGLTSGDQYRLVFLTSEETFSGGSNHGANPPWFTTIADYNAWATTQATSVAELNSLGTTWSAVVSTRDEGTNATQHAHDNTGTNPASGTGVPIYNLGGLIVANNNADLWDETIANPINVTELGTGPTAQGGGLLRVWTGTNPDGTRGGNRTLVFQDGGWIFNGLADATNLNWVGTNAADGWSTMSNPIHTEDQPIYVMSGILTVADQLATPEPSTFALVGLAVVGLLTRRRRRNR